MKRTNSQFVLLALTAVALLGAVVSADTLAGPHERGQARASVNRAGASGGNRVERNSSRTTVNNNRNVNVHSNRDVNINVDNHGGRYDDHYHPVATAAAVTATVAVTSAVVGSIVHANQLPPSCAQVMRGNVAYMQCGTVWYQPQYQGSDVAYVVVNQP
ncbi:hypothetical protein [Paraburkholderia sp. BCC1884]|uniref:hypothetical protein n=1 Tax=Paraburkholderia sp. BCC1884 TaxID=2562668 RepID=UPI0011842883|nr:hypothetical protein [Paraburkholderia sp. BCC1884]